MSVENARTPVCDDDRQVVHIPHWVTSFRIDVLDDTI